MKRFFSALFMYLQIGAGCGLMLAAIANAASASAGDPAGDEMTAAVAFCLIGAPLLIAGIAKFIKRHAFAGQSEPNSVRQRDVVR